MRSWKKFRYIYSTLELRFSCLLDIICFRIPGTFAGERDPSTNLVQWDG